MDVDLLVQAKYMINIEVTNIGDLFGMAFYCPTRYSDSQIEEIIHRFDLALSSMCQRRTLFEVLRDVDEGMRSC
jgi:hypothetical protein